MRLQGTSAATPHEMILADTSVWIEHLRYGSRPLADALEQSSVVVHPFVIGELACGTLHNRTETIGLLKRLPQAVTATDSEALDFLERRRLAGTGICWVDVHLLASAVLSSDAKLWTRDFRLARVAEQREVRYSPR